MVLVSVNPTFVILLGICASVKLKFSNAPSSKNCKPLATTEFNMAKTLIIFLLFPFLGCSRQPKVLLQDYSFLLTDGTVTKLHQSNDTLYELKCYIDRPCQPKPDKHYKILSSEKKEDFTILKLERLDATSLTSDPYPADRYYVLALKSINDEQLGYLPIVYSVTRKQVDTIRTDLQFLKDKFFYTYFSDSYLKELSAFKKLVTKDDASQIIEAVKSDKYKLLAQKYANTDTKDMYNAGFSSELLNRVCVDNGYNPIGAGEIIEKLLK